jgi:P pilus assembly chaperone PapD
MRIQLRSFAFGLALSAVIGTAQAAVIVTGTVDRLDIEASQAPILVRISHRARRIGA